MTQPSKNMVIPDKWLLDEVDKKQMMNENHTIKPIDLANIECVVLPEVAASSLETMARIF